MESDRFKTEICPAGTYLSPEEILESYDVNGEGSRDLMDELKDKKN